MGEVSENAAKFLYFIFLDKIRLNIRDAPVKLAGRISVSDILGSTDTGIWPARYPAKS